MSSARHAAVEEWSPHGQTGPVDLAELLQRTVRELQDAGIPDEALGILKNRRLSAPKFTPAGRAWRLGVLLLDHDARLYRIGAITRAVEPPRGVANKSAEAEERRELRRAAVRGKFAEGEVVNYGYEPFEPPVVDGVPMVPWNASGALRPLEDYLAERISLARET